MNSRPEQLLKETMHLRRQLNAMTSQRDFYCGLALAGWTLTVVLLFMVPA